MAAAVAAIIWLAPTAAVADDERPWAAGVSPEARARAEALFAEGIELHRKPLYREARAKYEEALRHWDHPSIHYNLVLILVRTDLPLEAHQHLVSALRFGPSALEPNEYEQALLLRATLDRQVVSLEVSCDRPGAQVMLDGKLLFTGPGREQRTVLVGEHSVSASAAGYVSRNEMVVVPPGKPYVIELALMTIEEATVYERRWTPWKPWAVVAGGVGMVLVGIPVQLQARAKRDQYEQAVDTLCPCPPEGPGSLPAAVEDLRTTGRWYNRVAIGTFVLGGAGIAAGVALAILNRPRAVSPELVSPPVFALEPLFGDGTRGVLATLRF